MIADTGSAEAAFRPGPAGARQAFLDALRRQFCRHDLDDETLEQAVSEAVGHLSQDAAGEGRDALLERLFEGRADAALHRSVVASLCLPAPRAPLQMPTQMLERPPVLPRLAALRAFARRRIGER
ncbi:hypothetical protein [Stappia sp. TSB10P1A]|uniref:hypothetical protein n=1 Tax=Stappia sp. TSB10P1A TaxID=2003585 RepID=UPI001643E696|nr:hypothetical protein [Stappia sp. TSB10P1A]